MNRKRIFSLVFVNCRTFPELNRYGKSFSNRLFCEIVEMHFLTKVLSILVTLHLQVLGFREVDRYYTELPEPPPGWGWELVNDQPSVGIDPTAMITVVEDPNANYIYNSYPFKPKPEPRYRVANDGEFWDLARVTQLLEVIAETENLKRRHQQNGNGFYLPRVRGTELERRSTEPRGERPSPTVSRGTERPPFSTSGGFENIFRLMNKTDPQSQAASLMYSSVAPDPNLLGFPVNQATIPFPPFNPFMIPGYENVIGAPHVFYPSYPFVPYQGWPVNPYAIYPSYQVPQINEMPPQRPQVTQDSSINNGKPSAGYPSYQVLQANGMASQRPQVPQDSKIYGSNPSVNNPSHGIPQRVPPQQPQVSQDTKIDGPGNVMETPAEQTTEKLVKQPKPVETNLTRTFIDPAVEIQKGVPPVESDITSSNGKENELLGSVWTNPRARTAKMIPKKPKPLPLNKLPMLTGRNASPRATPILHKQNKPQQYRIVYHLQKTYVPINGI